MDVYKFINSKDIRSHCEKTGHKFNPLETAFLIYQSDHHTAVEKHAAWNELICTMPDAERRVRRLQKNGDISHMTASGYRIHRETGCIRYECDHDYLSLEYYEKPLKGAYQKLDAISRFMKDNLPIDTLINSCCYIDSKTDADTFFKQIDYVSVK